MVRSLPSVSITADDTEVAVPDQTTFTVVVSNLGAGAAFDVEIDPAQSLLAMTGDTTSVGGYSLRFDSWVGLPADATTGSGSVVSLPHVGPGESVTFQLRATAISCGDMSVEVDVDDLYMRDTSEPAIEGVASLRLKIEEPLLVFDQGPQNMALQFGEWTAFTVVLENEKDGAASSVTLDTTLESLSGTVEVRFTGANSDGWTYNASNGTFFVAVILVYNRWEHEYAGL